MLCTEHLVLTCCMLKSVDMCAWRGIFVVNISRFLVSRYILKRRTIVDREENKYSRYSRGGYLVMEPPQPRRSCGGRRQIWPPPLCLFYRLILDRSQLVRNRLGLEETSMASELGAWTPSETQATPAPSLPGTGEVATLRLVDEDEGDGSATVISVPSSAPSEDAVCEPDPATHAYKSLSATAEDGDAYMMDAEVVAAEPPLPASSSPAASPPQDDAASTDQGAASAECAVAAANPAIASSPEAPDENGGRDPGLTRSNTSLV